MYIVVDEPLDGVSVTTSGFLVRGWLWLDAAHREIDAIEALVGEAPAGEARQLYHRPDVVATLGLPPGTAVAFHFVARAPRPSAAAPFDVHVRARFKDGTHTHLLASRALTPVADQEDPLALLWKQLSHGARGLEIGAHAQPAPGLAPFYTDIVAEFDGQTGRADFLSDARALPLTEAALDYLCSSHVLEHVPDPISALLEWHRVLRPGGWLYLIVPDKRFTFDAPRAVTSVAHLRRDFLRGATAANSPEHIDEFVYQTDWAKLHPEWPATERPGRQAASEREYRERLRDGRPIDVHFHTFTPDSLRATLDAAGLINGSRPAFEIRAMAERFPPERGDGFAVLLQRTGKPPGDGRPGSTITTFELSHANADTPPLPLVCPISLEPLHEETAADGSHALVAPRSGRRYPHQGTLPALLPPAGVNPRRPWTRRPWRLARHLGANLRLAFAATKP
jgi:SAM-dependent methyltransferase